MVIGFARNVISDQELKPECGSMLKHFIQIALDMNVLLATKSVQIMLLSKITKADIIEIQHYKQLNKGSSNFELRDKILCFSRMTFPQTQEKCFPHM